MTQPISTTNGVIADCVAALRSALPMDALALPPTTRDLLDDVLRYAARAEQEIVLRQQRIAELEHGSRIDPVTGLDNRRGLDATFTRFQAACARYDEPAALVVLAIEEDTPAGGLTASVARAVAQRIETQVRKTDAVARINERTFVVLLSRCPLGHARSKATQLEDMLNDLRVPDQPGGVMLAALSGVATFGGQTSLDRALAAADHDLARTAARHPFGR